MTLSEEQLKEIEQILLSIPAEKREEKLKELIPEEELKEIASQKQCPFCLIAENKIQAFKIYETNSTLAVLDINPANPGHILIFPKKHSPFPSEEEMKDIISISHKLIKNSKNQNFNIISSIGQLAGQRIDHFILNLIPRFEKDNLNFFWQSKKVSPEQLKQLQESLKIEEEKPSPKKEFKAKKSIKRRNP